MHPRLRVLFKTPILAAASIFLLAACGSGGSSDTNDPATIQLELLSITPGDGDTGVALNTAVELNFNASIDPGSLNGNYTFELLNRGTSTTLGGQLTLANSGQTLRFIPNTLLQPDTEHSVTLHSGLAGMAGEQWPTSLEWTFTTEDLENLGHTQDFWIFEQWRRISRSHPERDISTDIANYLEAQSHPDQRIQLIDGVSFTPMDDLLLPELLQPQAGSTEPQPRTDIELIAGLLEHDGKSAIAVLATPRETASRGISFDDDLSIDLSFLGDATLAPGDALIVDYAFVQGIPSPQDADTNEGLALFKSRLEAESISYFGLERLEGPEVLLYSDQLGVARAGSVKGVLPAKAGDMIDGMRDGLNGCKFGNKCVADFFKDFGQGAKSSFDQALENMAPDPPPPDYGIPNENDRDRNRERRRPLCLTRRCGENNGDPHMTTFDGSKYDMMAVGEFTLAKNADMEVQIRTQPWRDLDNASAAIAVAVQLGETRLTFDQQAPWTERIRVNGDIVDPMLLGRYTLEQQDTQIILVGNTLQIFGLDHQISIVHYPLRQFLNVYIDLPDVDNVQLIPETMGLLGKVSDNSSDDFTPRNGQTAIDPADMDALYDDFIDSWRITDTTSLFDYRSGESTASFTDLNFPESRRTIDDLTMEQRVFAEQICDAAGLTSPGAEYDNCLFDVGFTGEPDFAATARTAQLAERIRQGTFDPNNMALGGRIPLDNPYDIDWLTTGAMVRQALDNPSIAVIRCPELPDSYSFRNRTVWGAELYRENSNLCRAGVHAGAAGYDEGGTFAVRFLSAEDGNEQDDAKAASNQNGVRSQAYTTNERAFDVLSTDEHRSCVANLEVETLQLPSELQSLFTPALIDELKHLGASFYSGTTPPTLEGTFQANDLNIIFDDEGRDPDATNISSYQYQFSDHAPNGTILYSYSGLGDSSEDRGTASAAYVTGNRDCFTVFARFDDVAPGCTRSGIEVISGRLDGNRILGFDNAFQFYRAFDGADCTENVGYRTVLNNQESVNKLQN